MARALLINRPDIQPQSSFFTQQRCLQRRRSPYTTYLLHPEWRGFGINLINAVIPESATRLSGIHWTQVRPALSIDEEVNLSLSPATAYGYHADP
jgi:hypothetical protein